MPCIPLLTIHTTRISIHCNLETFENDSKMKFFTKNHIFRFFTLCRMIFFICKMGIWWENIWIYLLYNLLPPGAGYPYTWNWHIFLDRKWRLFISSEFKIKTSSCASLTKPFFNISELFKGWLSGFGLGCSRRHIHSIVLVSRGQTPRFTGSTFAILLFSQKFPYFHIVFYMLLFSIEK